VRIDARLPDPVREAAFFWGDKGAGAMRKTNVLDLGE